MATIGTVVVGIRAVTQPFASGLSKAGSMLGGFAKSINAVNPAILSFAGNIAKEAVGALSDLVFEGIGAIDDLGDTAAGLGMTAGEFQKLQYVAKLTGSEMDALGPAIQKMNVNLANGKGSDTLDKLGLSVSQLRSMSPAEAFETVAGAISTIESPSDRAAASMDIFGKQGLNLINTLSAGPDAMNALKTEAEDLGFVLSDQDAAAAGAAQDALDKLKFAGQGVANLFAAKVAPFITDVANRFLAWAKTSVNAGSFINGALSVVGTGIGFVADTLKLLQAIGLGVWGAMQMSLGGFIKGLGWVGQGLEDIINLLPGVKVEFAGFISDVGDEMLKMSETSLKDSGQAFKDFWNKPPSDGINQWFRGVQASAAQLGTEVEKTGTAVAALDEESIKLGDSVKELEDKLRLSIDTFGMSSTEAELFKLAQSGAGEETLATAKALAEELRQLEEDKKAHDDLKSKAKSVFEATRTEAEKYNEKIAELTKLRDSDLIDQDTFDRAKAKAEEELKGKDEKKKDEPQFASALELGSQEARAALLRHSFGDAAGGTKNPNKKLEDLSKEQNDFAREGVQVMRTIWKALTDDGGTLSRN